MLQPKTDRPSVVIVYMALQVINSYNNEILNNEITMRPRAQQHPGQRFRLSAKIP
jgi:hypothetical protein